MNPAWSLALPVAAAVVDAAVGDPRWRWLPHPVVIIGSAIARLERLLNRPSWSCRARRVAGAVTTSIVVGSTYTATWCLLYLAWRASPWLGAALSVWIFSTTLAARGLADAGLEIAALLEVGDLPEARRKVGWIVGRDTQHLAGPDICRAALETVAENTSDGIVAPLLYGILGGPALAMAYKAVNTLDSMVGHKNERYLDFGWASAKLDDLANFVPARLSGLLICVASWLTRRGWHSAWAAICGSAHLHPSPNSGYPEAAMAGALGVELGGLNYYDGVPQARARMGRPGHPVAPTDVRGAVLLMRLSSALALAALTGIRAMV